MLHRALALSFVLVLPALNVEAASVSPPPFEGATGSANSDIRSEIISGTGCTTITILGIDLEKCPALTFGSYGPDRGADEGATGVSDTPSGGQPGGGGPSNPGGGNPGRGDSGSGNPGDSPSDSPGNGDRGGSRDRSEDCRR